ncbi:hypothetical protein RIF29_35077 [Crotalaria pallida]|uniref:Receptor-like serine/threonine-protein kinase n=1 Tax=Crotalaria pallida TaxID=3830 RepID=A0AAN9HTV0_CROPI
MVCNFRMLCIWFCLMSNLMSTSTSVDSLATNQSIRDDESLVSADGSFELGFFSPGKSTARYLGVWYRDISGNSTVVWVANRETPLENVSGVLRFNEEGNLNLFNDKSNITVWSSNISSKAVNDNNDPIVAQLLDSGNLVVKNGDSNANNDSFLWQSFDYPCDAVLPGMKLGWNLVTGLDRIFTSWKSEDDPAVGEYSLKLVRQGYPQIFQFKGFVIKTRSGPWNGHYFNGYAPPNPNQYSYELVLNEKEVYFEYQVMDRSIYSILYKMPPSGSGQRLVWSSRNRNLLENTSTAGQDQCENYATCGSNSICYMDGDIVTCECLKGFVPKNPEQWNISHWSDGCVLRTKLDCNNSNTDGFLIYTNMKLPDTSSSWFSETMNFEDCRNSCLKNCSCTAYANLDIRDGGNGCLLWFDSLVDMRLFSKGGEDLYVRVPASELGHVAVNGHRNVKKVVGVTVGVIIFGLIIFVCIMIIKNSGSARKFYSKHNTNKLRNENIDLPTFDFSVIANATGNFSSRNKLGEGGFGPVYKGTLTDGQELAVKRLSKKSGQGSEELKNEVALIAKLQHRNLVKLLGYCIQGEEKMLIYEYMPNKSLDNFIFDDTRRKLLDWPKRFKIISGIARGLLYLHQDSRLRIIHRDLKISNILLDANLDPKISDFGLARMLLADQLEENTNRVAGTYGYMSPEYAGLGNFSVKSDVFSYGVIVLEIVCGKKNRVFLDPQQYQNLLGHAWRLWREDRALELLDEVFGETCTPSDVIRCIQVGLLCVQHRPEDRPDMSSVVLMLNGEKLLPKPTVPGFYYSDVTRESDSSLANSKLLSANEISTTVLEAR